MIKLILFTLSLLLASPYNFDWFPYDTISIALAFIIIFCVLLEKSEINYNKLIPLLVFIFFPICALVTAALNSKFLLPGLFWSSATAISCFLSKSDRYSKYIVLGLFFGAFIATAVDFNYRFSNFQEGINFYKLKFGVVGNDSNYTAIYLIFSSILFYSHFCLTQKIKLIFWVTIFILLLSTLSRSSLICWLIFPFVYERKILFPTKYYLLFIPFLSPLFTLVLQDDSALQKIQSIVPYIEILVNKNSLLFGLADLPAVQNTTPHLLFLQIILLYGIFGLFIYLFFLVLISLKNRLVATVTFIYLILGLSFVPMSSPFLTIVFVIAYTKKNLRKDYVH